MFLNKKILESKLGYKPVVGFTCSTFDLFHVGHVIMLQEAKSVCDYLIAGLLVDPTRDRPIEKNRPVQSMMERYIQVSACRYVDEVIPFDSELDLYNLLQLISPDIRIVGEEYKGLDFTGDKLTPIYYNRRNHPFSSSELRERVYDAGNV